MRLSFLQVQDGVFENISNIVMRLGELYSMSQDVLQDGRFRIYDSEIADLATQLADYTTASNTTFNGVDVMLGAALTVQAGDQSIDVSRLD